jgi:mannose/cellobiose epimerase-like protein (N-acyl-D-glucosamine 2-epimerase family)
VQARQIYSYGSAVAQGWAGPWRQAAEHGLHWHRAHYRRADGLYRTLVAADGSTVNDEALLYDQAFTLLALSALYRAGVSAPSAQEEADSLLQQVVRTFGDPSGGFREVSDQPLQANPQMHLFEAALAWIEARHAPAWREIADGLAERALTRFRHADSGAVGEVFRRDGVEGPGLEPGHQFKWAGLLERWSRLSGDGRAHAAARRLMEAGREGVDTVRGVVLDESPQARGGGQARLRPQAERLKAVLIMSEAADDPAVWRREAAQALQGLNRYLEPAGLWRNEMLEDGSFVVEPAAASSLHHLMAAGLAVERVLGGGAAA